MIINIAELLKTNRKNTPPTTYDEETEYLTEEAEPETTSTQYSNSNKRSKPDRDSPKDSPKASESTSERDISTVPTRAFQTQDVFNNQNIYRDNLQNLESKIRKVIIYEYLHMEQKAIAWRKWGFIASTVDSWATKLNADLKDQGERKEWMSKHRVKGDILRIKLRLLNIRDVKKDVRNRLKYIYMNDGELITLKDLYKLGFIWGIGKVALNYSIPILTLEHLMKTICRSKWGYMESNSWFMSPKVIEPDAEIKMKIIHAHNTKGTFYALKKYHIANETLTKFKLEYQNNGSFVD